MDIKVVNVNKFQLTFALSNNLDDHLRNLWLSIDGCKEHINDEVKYYDTGLEHPMFNGVIYTRFSENNLEEKVHQVISFFTERNLPFIWHLTSVSLPINLSDFLKSSTQMTFEYEPSGMVYDLRKFNPSTINDHKQSEVKIIQVKTMEHYEQCMQVLEEIYGIPKVYISKYVEKLAAMENPVELVYIGLIENEPVAFGSIFFSAGVVGVHNMGTTEKWRKKGIARMLMEKIMLDAKSWGYTWMVLSSTDMAFHLYESLGFEKICSGQRFYWVP